MTPPTLPCKILVRRSAGARPGAGPRSRPWRTALAAAALLAGGSAQALEAGPFTLNGFVKAEFSRVSNNCPTCQRFPEENKQRFWADELVPGARYKGRETHVVLAQPYIGVKFDLGKGWKASGLISQRWRDGQEDIPGFWYDKNIALSHEDWGSVRFGAMTTRGWSMADYPYGSNVGVADIWGSAGAGYGLLTRALRVTTRPLDVLDGDLVLEATYDPGKQGWQRNKPHFLELYAQYARPGLVIDAMLQETRNGTPAAWGHGPFTGLTPFPRDDGKLGGSGQSMAMVMARHEVTTALEVSGGLRRNRWSGAYAAITQFENNVAQWNSMFNVDWTRDLGGGVFRGYPATSTDVMLGLRYRMGAWVAHTGLVHLGKGSTDNPTESGQSNSATVNSLGLAYEFTGTLRGLQAYGLAGMVTYGLPARNSGCTGQPSRRPGTCSLSPISMPGNAAFTNVDSRVARHGHWFGVGAVYAF